MAGFGGKFFKRPKNAYVGPKRLSPRKDKFFFFFFIYEVLVSGGVDVGTHSTREDSEAMLIGINTASGSDDS